MRKKLPDAEELAQRIHNFFDGYYLIGARKDKEAFFALEEEDLKKYPVAICGVFLNHVMDGDLDKAWKDVQFFEDGSFHNIALKLVHPQTSLTDFIKLVNLMKERKMPVHSLVLSAGRPFLLNGVSDFTRLGPFLEKKKDLFIEDLKYIYDDSAAESIYELCLAEYYYYQNRLTDAEVTLTKTIERFDMNSERRFLFVALYLQSKVLIASGKIKEAGMFIPNIKNFVKEEGVQEFSDNIDAAEAFFALYDGNFDIVAKWFDDKAPNEYSDFNMLDLYRYMMKIRCYIIYKKYTAVIALVERLRPLLIAGHREMDLCELDILLSISFFRSGETPLALEAIERALKFVKRHGYYRLIADEGYAVLSVLVAYSKEKGRTPFIKSLTVMTRKMSVDHPKYLCNPLNKESKFTVMEVTILTMLEQGKTIEQMAGFFFISISAIKFHLKKIYRKLDAISAHQAVWEARRLGII